MKNVRMKSDLFKMGILLTTKSMHRQGEAKTVLGAPCVRIDSAAKRVPILKFSEFFSNEAARRGRPNTQQARALLTFRSRAFGGALYTHRLSRRYVSDFEGL